MKALFQTPLVVGRRQVVVTMNWWTIGTKKAQFSSNTHTSELFSTNEMEEGGHPSFNLSFGVRDQVG